MSHKFSLLRNTLYFHRHRFAANTVALSCYVTFCHVISQNNNQVLRMGVAGSIAHGTVEALFHFVDTVNIKSKAIKTAPNAFTMV
jgi:hypothetical protein